MHIRGVLSWSIVLVGSSIKDDMLTTARGHAKNSGEHTTLTAALKFVSYPNKKAPLMWHMCPSAQVIDAVGD